MDKEERLRGNELIARYSKRMFPSSCISDYIHGLPESINKRYLHYHTSWGELMPVVKRILPDIRMKYLYPNNREEYHLLVAKGAIIEKCVKELEIEPIWTAVIEAIQVINTLNSKTDGDNK